MAETQTKLSPRAVARDGCRHGGHGLWLPDGRDLPHRVPWDYVWRNFVTAGGDRLR
jgi:hypothetical protein